jgi:hypothetical protein
MSSNENDMISLSNYEEWFVLYMDDELTTTQKLMVENFLLQHPQLQEEMDLLLSTKLPLAQVSFDSKADLLADAMKLNLVDENLLLYMDNELPAAEKRAVEEKITADETYRLQHAILQQTKLDPKEVIPYPNKKELYRHTEKVVVLQLWMRIAAVVVLILFATLFFVLNNGKQPITTDIAVKAKPQEPKQEQAPSNFVLPSDVFPKEGAVAVNTIAHNKKTERFSIRTNTAAPKKDNASEPATEEQKTVTRRVETASVGPVATIKLDVAKIDIAKLTSQPTVAVNNFVASPTVTSATPASFNPTNTRGVTAAIDGDDKPNRTPAKGFLRKVSRFLERRTGIGTVNADNELLVGAVALKLN